MPRYRIRRIVWEEADLEEDEVMTMSEAARELGRDLTTVITQAERGALTMVIDKEKVYHGRRLVLRSEVEKMKEDHPA